MSIIRRNNQAINVVAVVAGAVIGGVVIGIVIGFALAAGVSAVAGAMITKKVAVGGAFVARITAAGSAFVSLAVTFNTTIYPIATAYAAGLGALTGDAVAAHDKHPTLENKAGEDTNSQAETAHFTASSSNGSSSPPS